MRTCLSLDDDVATALERIGSFRRESFESIVNKALRHSVRQMPLKPSRRRILRTKSVALGRCRAGSLDNIAEILATTDGDSFK